jgi:hypothetical protein
MPSRSSTPPKTLNNNNTTNNNNHYQQQNGTHNNNNNSNPQKKKSSITTTTTPFSTNYSPNIFVKLFILIQDSFYGLFLLLIGIPSYVWDAIRQMITQEIPGSIDELVNIEAYSRLSGRVVTKVEYSNQKEQHAHSTDRAWLRVRYADDNKDTLVFAKCAAKDFLVRAMMSIFDVYRNEINAYSNIKMPVTTPEVHIAKWSRSRFVLVMEDLSSKGVTFPNIWSTHVDWKLGTQVLTTLARIHAEFWNDNIPDGIWTDKNRPYFGIGMGFYTLFNVQRRCRADLFSQQQVEMFKQSLWHWNTYRSYLSSKKDKIMCGSHCDTHFGNFYIKKDGSIGTFDFQVVSEENCIRDVTYFLTSSYDPDLLEKDEKQLIQFYLDKLEEFGVPSHEVPTFEQAWFGYRIQTFITLYSFVFSGGFSNLMDHVQTECGVSRILRVMDRIDSQGALYDVLSDVIDWRE